MILFTYLISQQNASHKKTIPPDQRRRTVKMPKKAAIVKNCPKCEQNSAVASKSCKCGYSFFNARRNIGRPDSSSATGNGSGAGRHLQTGQQVIGSRSRSQQQQQQQQHATTAVGAAPSSSSPTLADVDADESRRRTARVRREKPNYYDSQEFDKKKKKKERRVRQQSSQGRESIPIR